MKKTYIQPQMDIVTIGTCSMICTSLRYGGNTTDGGITTADSPEFDWFDE